MKPAELSNKIDIAKREILSNRYARVLKEVAKEFLLRNESTIIGGNVRHYQIKDLGLGVCEIRLLPLGFSAETRVVTDWLDI